MSGGTPSGLGPLFVAMLVVGIGASLGGPTGYAINPARDLGPRIAHAILPIRGKGASDWGYSWIPVVGPIVGAVIAALLFLAIGGSDIFPDVQPAPSSASSGPDTLRSPATGGLNRPTPAGFQRRKVIL